MVREINVWEMEGKGKLDPCNIIDGLKRTKEIQRRKKEGAVRQKHYSFIPL